MTSIREQYQKYGVEEYYKLYGRYYFNYHQESIHNQLRRYQKNLTLTRDMSVLDMCCGDGIVTQFLMEHGFNNIDGCDGYLTDLYIKKTGRPCTTLTFKDIVQGKLQKQYDVIICSFALHLCDTSMLQPLMQRLTANANKLIVISHFKKIGITAKSDCWQPMQCVASEGTHSWVYERKYICG